MHPFFKIVNSGEKLKAIKANNANDQRDEYRTWKTPF